MPNDRKSIGCKWVNKIKYKSNGELERYKARLVAKVYSQKEGMGYEKTFSPVVNIVVVRCLINLVGQNQWPLFELDINNAFLCYDLCVIVYMSLPQGYFDSTHIRVCMLKSLCMG